ncbi:arsenate reductase/protein-tyrosine-phosphatase family protein [Erwinia tasmaniensis]|uniref:protein-tyrosine-phosphatase n=1 Tax=Erwinia tasmaniensis (strain DSM 17950 / CFBP 7177 / CIP 109463 / NCPPB 4357 / Et1/99) TaxID=465817 RepID=B2VFN9_ERWT9|nr:protein-tyrosine-phosphatase [Erwinia tasmaniensis]CAO96369.1 Probable protein-tyrosine-phosphatase [Erwinia tasmaniensis Et1/99]
MINSILVVCIGNICRSPTGERLLNSAMPEKRIASAGLKAVVGSPADATASSVAEQHGMPLQEHVAQQLTSEMCRDNDLILVMEKKHIDLVCRINPSVRGKTMLFGHWINQHEIADPYKKSRDAFEAVYGVLENAAQKWVNALSR